VLAGVLESIVDTLDEWAHFVILVVLVAVTVLTSIHRLITASILLQVSDAFDKPEVMLTGGWRIFFYRCAGGMDGCGGE